MNEPLIQLLGGRGGGGWEQRPAGLEEREGWGGEGGGESREGGEVSRRHTGEVIGVQTWDNPSGGLSDYGAGLDPPLKNRGVFSWQMMPSNASSTKVPCD